MRLRLPRDARPLVSVPTPALLLDPVRLQRNLARMRDRAKALNVRLRPHLKTAKSAEIAGRAGSPAITVSTLAEARYFAQAGISDITYAVGLAPAKLPEVMALRSQRGRRSPDGVALRVLVDSVTAAQGLASSWAGPPLGVLIEIDCGAHRGGVPAQDSQHLVAMAAALMDNPRLGLSGVLTHAGHAYGARNQQEIAAIAEQERAAVVMAAATLRQAGHDAPVVSVGSTPTALFADHLDGVTEMRPGVYMLFDRFQAHLGCCAPTDLAVSVLASVIGRREDKGYGLIDAGALALSQDTCMEAADGHRTYGAVLGMQGHPWGDLVVTAVHQEHGFIRSPSGATALPEVGEQVRIAPNHVCMTAAPYPHYLVEEKGLIVDQWDKLVGW